jgi:hypothetical protein
MLDINCLADCVGACEPIAYFRHGDCGDCARCYPASCSLIVCLPLPHFR